MLVSINNDLITTIFLSVELIGVSHVVDAITFWAQNVNDQQAVERITKILSEKCPKAQKLLGNPNPQRLYGALFSEDNYWYRCKVQQNKDDMFEVCYVDYGNAEIVSRSSLVELPEDLQTPSFAKKYKFWSLHLCSDVNSQHFVQGKIFLHNLIYGKKLRIQRKSECFDGTVLVHAFQGNLDIGEEVTKMKFAKLSILGNRESPHPVCLQDSPAFWSQSVLELGSKGESERTRSLMNMPKLRPAYSHQVPLALKEKSTATALQPANLLKKNRDKELVEENERLKEEVNTQRQAVLILEKQLHEVRAEVQRAKDVMLKNVKEKDMLLEERSVLQQKADNLREQLSDAQLKLQVIKQQADHKEEVAERRLETAVEDKLRQLAQKVESLRGVRSERACRTVGDSLLSAISIVTNDRISPPVAMEKLDNMWKEYNSVQDMVKACKMRKAIDLGKNMAWQREELQALIDKRNDVRSALALAVDDYLQEVDKLPISKRMSTLKEVSASLTAVFGSFWMENVGEDAFDRFRQWKSQKQQEAQSVREGTDEAVKSLCSWFGNMAKVFSLSSETAGSSTDITGGADALLHRAERNVDREVHVSFTEQNDQDVKIVSDAFHKVMQQVKAEQDVLCVIQEKHLLNTRFKKEVLQCQNETPKMDELFSVKRRIKNLRSQLRWKLVEEGTLEEAEEVDLSEIQTKKEEIAKTREALFQEICREKEEYKRLSVLTKDVFPELPLLFPEADLHSYMASDGLVMKSLDRDLFDSEPLRELSALRPLVCTEFQGQRVVLKGYSINKEAEAKMVDVATEYHKASVSCEQQTILVPLLAVFFGKCDPLAYVMVPYFAGGSLQIVQKSSPLNSSEVLAVMKGVALGLQALHGFGITHSSLHPNNVFVLNRARGLLGDFDFTRSLEQRAAGSGMWVGSLSLTAPEVRQGQVPSPASDMYAFGCLLLWLHFPEINFALMPDGRTPDTRKLKLDSKFQRLLSSLLSDSGRLTASEVLTDDYFLEF